jgi:nitrous oxidase accessory protein NosD
MSSVDKAKERRRKVLNLKNESGVMRVNGKQLLTHNYKLVTRLVSAAACLLLFALPSNSYSKTITVGVDYSTIGDALEKAEDGDLIEVKEGMYKERLRIDKNVHIKGINKPVISVSKGNIVEISKPDVIFEGFTLTYDSTDLDS